MRVYLPATLAMLAELVADGYLQPRSGTAFAVTPTLREAYAEGDQEELAEVAIGEAALASLRLLSGEPAGELAAVYVDNAAAEPAVRAAIDVIDDADLGDEDAELTVGDAQDHDLAWYATQELPFLLDLL